ncbi:MAG TPA: hypothetical protein VFS43_26370 [Polyangiaceae bacterium]|nr:hypothetical protein [Polyangiaceae bacterium]
MQSSAFARLASAFALCLTAALAAGCADSGEPESTGSGAENANAAGGKATETNTQQISTFGGAATDRVTFQGDAQVRVDEIDLDPGQRLAVTDGTGAVLLDVSSEANGQPRSFTARGGSVRFQLGAGEGGYAATVTTAGGGGGGGLDQATCDRVCRLGVQLAQCAPCR